MLESKTPGVTASKPGTPLPRKVSSPTTNMKTKAKQLLPKITAPLVFAALATSLPAATSIFDTDYEAGTYNWAPLQSYNLSGNQSTDSFRDLTWFTNGDQSNYSAVWNNPSFTSPGGVTVAGHEGTSIGSYIKWGIIGTGTMPPMPIVAAIQSGTVTQALLDANPITPKALDAERVFTVSTSTPLDGLSNIILQLRTGTIFPDSPEFTPFQLAQMAGSVVLSLNQGTILREWDFREMTHLSQDMFSTTYTQEVWAFQWDLSDIDVPITDFSIGWDSHPFGNIFGVQIDQSNSFTQVIPEPSSLGLAAVGLSLCLRRTRRIKRDA